MNDIDKLDGMIKIKGKCGYEFIGGCKELRKHKQALEEIREIAKFNQFYNPEKLLINGDIGQIQNLKMTEIYNKINEALEDSEDVENN